MSAKIKPPNPYTLTTWKMPYILAAIFSKLSWKKKEDKFPKNSEYGLFGGFTRCKPDEMEVSWAFILEKCKLTYT